MPWSQEPALSCIAPRGVSSVLLSRMLHEVDVELSADQYAKTREHFVDALFGVIPGVREYPKGETGSGDIDSGPLIFGFSLSASVVGIAAARFHGDIAFAGPATIVAHAAGMPLLGRYAFGLMPVGEAFFVWSKTARPWIGPEASPVETAPLVRPGWRFTCLLLGLALCTLLFAPELWRLSPRRGPATPN